MKLKNIIKVAARAIGSELGADAVAAATYVTWFRLVRRLAGYEVEGIIFILFLCSLYPLSCLSVRLLIGNHTDGRAAGW